MMNIPRHIAIIPDGNRRWAKRHHLSSASGHEEGAKALQDVLETVYKLGVTCFSFWGASEDNILKRSSREVQSLEKLYEINFRKLAEDSRIHEKEVRINVIGQWETLLKSEAAKHSIQMVINATKKYNKYLLNFFIAYNGVSEMVIAIERIIKKLNHTPDFIITPQLIKANLFTNELPPVDLLIRTGGEPHLSAGFMMWDISDTQLYFSEKYWPEFTGHDLEEAIKTYAKRQRRHGK